MRETSARAEALIYGLNTFSRSRAQMAARLALPTLSFFVLLAHSSVPALPTNIIENLAHLQSGILHVFWSPQGELTTETRFPVVLTQIAPGKAV